MRGEQCGSKAGAGLGSLGPRGARLGNRRLRGEGRADQRHRAALGTCRPSGAVIVQGHQFSKLGGISPAVTRGLGAGPETRDGWDFA